MLSLTELSWYDKNGKLQNILDFVYPVGSIYMTMNSQNPSTLFGGEWVAWGQGRVPVGAGTGTDSNSVSKTFVSDETGGEYNHTLSASEMPKHNHSTQHPNWNESVEYHYQDGTGTLKFYDKTYDTYYTPDKTTAFNEKTIYKSESELLNVKEGVGRTIEKQKFYSAVVEENGNDQPHNNIQPYITCYMWKRTA